MFPLSINRNGGHPCPINNLENKMKYIQAFLLLFLLPCIMSAQTVIKPRHHTATTFAIIVDDSTYHATESSINAYRQVVEADGLGTYIIYHQWSSPQQIRDILEQLHQKDALEGAVLVGNIPIPMIRDAQHLTSAFKMNQKAKWQMSSVPSDRFYDDFGLKFRFLKQDSQNKSLFYYSLLPDGDQIIKCDIYTARVRPLRIPGRDYYGQIASYFNKVVRERKAHQDNQLDTLSMARGHGYNSEDKTAWAGEQLALRDQMPALFTAGKSVRFIDFESRYPAKPYYLNEVQRPGLDVMLFHHHGEVDTQYLNGEEARTDIAGCKNNIISYLHSLARREENPALRDSVANDLSKRFGVPKDWVTSAFDPEEREKDSLAARMKNIYTTDLRDIAPTARFIMFDACFNGSFHHDDYIAGNYLFSSKGRCLVAQGNTVNTIQDKWPDELLGLLQLGARVGEWHRHVCYLETHLLGDPTYHFAPTVKVSQNFAQDIVRHDADVAYWQKLSESSLADVQCLALRHLTHLRGKAMSPQLKETFFSSPFSVVRLEALKQLRGLGGDDFVTVLRAALQDPYELTRRFAAIYANAYSDSLLANDVAEAFVVNYTDGRSTYNLQNAMTSCGNKVSANALRQVIDKRQLVDKKPFESQLEKMEQQSLADEYMRQMTDTTVKESRRLSALRFFRNQPYTYALPSIMSIMESPSASVSLRTCAAEVLGWYCFGSKRDAILSRLVPYESTLSDGPVKQELKKTIARLRQTY